MQSNIRIIRPASREREDLLPDKIIELKDHGFKVLYDDRPETQWPYIASSKENRAQDLLKALTEKDSDIILCARGGYGASDLLPLIPWDDLKDTPEKLLIGFSDISAIHSALYTKLGWRSLHGPMPATSLWDHKKPDIKALLNILSQKPETIELSLTPLTQYNDLSGILFGGCFSVLTNLIGTPYFPKSLDGHILFLEDVGEHPARIMRYLNQWIQSGALRGVRGIVLGHFRNLGEGIEDDSIMLLEEFAKRAQLPTWSTKGFGHLSPNMPLMIGKEAQINNDVLSWNFNPQEKGNIA